MQLTIDESVQSATDQISMIDDMLQVEQSRPIQNKELIVSLLQARSTAVLAYVIAKKG